MEGFEIMGAGLFSKMVHSWKKELFCDVTIVCEDNKSIKAPSILMDVLSDLLSDVLKKCCDNVLTTSDIPVSLWRSLLTVIYENNVTCLKDQFDAGTLTVTELNAFAECLQITSVAEMCKKELENARQKYQNTTDPLQCVVLSYNVETEKGIERIETHFRSNIILKQEDTTETPVKEETVDFKLQSPPNSKTKGIKVNIPSNICGKPHTSAQDRNHLLQQRNEKVGPKIEEASVMGKMDSKKYCVLIQEGEKFVITTGAPGDDKASLNIVKACLNCGENCTAARVKCQLCFRDVNAAGVDHARTYHPFSKNSVWPVTCDVTNTQRNYDKALIGAYVYSPKKKSLVFKCFHCSIEFILEDSYESHLQAHCDTVFTCSNKDCHAAFAINECQKEHQYFCEGGDILKCGECTAVLGEIASYENHNCREIDNSVKQVKKRFKSVIPNKPALPEVRKGNVLKRLGTDLVPIDSLKGARKVGHLTKACTKCANDCNANEVMCIYCGVRVRKNEEVRHVVDNHSETPGGLLWPVICTFLKNDAGNGFIVCKYGALDSGISKQTSMAYKCCLCPFSCLTQENITSHLEQAHAKKVLYCKVCRHGFTSQSRRDQHQFFCSGNKLFSCTRCHLRYIGSLEDAEDHEETIHGSTKNIDRRLFREHVRTPEELAQRNARIQRCFQCGVDGCKIPKRDIKCVYCNAIVPNDVKHMEEHPFIPEGSIWPVSCRYQTGKGSQHGNPVAAIKYTSEENSKKTYLQCVTCSCKLGSVQAMVSHVKLKHSKFSRECKYCDTVFNRYETWRDHEHFCGGGEVLICNICGILCGGLKALSDHICRNHPDAKGLKAPSGSRESQKKGKVKTEQQDSDISEEDKQEDTKTERPSNDQLVSRLQVCYVCGENGCSREIVKCMYCYRVVPNHLQHMLDHPFIPLDSCWPVSCKSDDSIHPTSEAVCEKIYSGKAMKTKLRCMMCTKFLTMGQKEMFFHLNLAHKLDTIHTCQLCETMFQNADDLTYHKHFCSGGKLVKCSVCAALCGGTNELYVHMETYHSYRTSEFNLAPPAVTISDEGIADELTELLVESTSPSCVDEREPEENLKVQHENAHKQCCFVCEGPCRNAKDRNNRVKCLLCFQVVPNSLEHMQDMHPFTNQNIEWKVTCKQYRLQTTNSESSFVVTKTKSHGPLKCLLCNFITDAENQSTMHTHFKDAHNSSVYFCKHCSQGFRRVALQKDHERFCSGEDFPVCNFCGRRCSGHGNLLDHVQKEHGKHQVHHLKRTLDETTWMSGNNKDTEVMLCKIPRPSKDYFEEFNPARGTPDENGIVTLCAECGTACASTNVRCLLCFEVLANDSSHLLEHHQHSRAKHWVVSCQNLDHGVAEDINSMPGSFLVGKAGCTAFVVDESTGECRSEALHTNISCMLKHNDESLCIFDSLVDFGKHIKYYHSLDFEPFQICQICNTIFSVGDSEKLSKFEDHSHYCAGSGLFRCLVCLELFASKLQFIQHEQNAHREPILKTGRAEYINVPAGSFIQCSECSSNLSTFIDYKDHMIMEHRYKKTQIQVCRFCLITFRMRSLREEHEQVEHCGGQRFHCAYCPKNFTTPSQLTFHTKYYHEGGRLKQKVYRNNKPKIPCSFCGKLFRLAIHVRDHERRTHMQQKPYQCRCCGQRFTNHSTRRIHEDRHVGIKRYKCPYCEYRAFKGSRVNDHIKIQHPGKGRAFGWDHVDVGNEVTQKGNVITIGDNIVYKPRIRLDECTSEDKDEPTPEIKTEQMLLNSLPHETGSGVININIIPRVNEPTITDPIESLEKVDNDGNWMTVYMSKADLNALDTRENVTYIVDDTLITPTEEDISTTVTYAEDNTIPLECMQGTVEHSDQPSNLQYTLSVNNETQIDSIQYVINEEEFEVLKQQQLVLTTSPVVHVSGIDPTAGQSTSQQVFYVVNQN